MPFGPYDASSTFQRCMISRLSDIVKQSLKIDSNHFSIYNDSFNDWLANVGKVLKGVEISIWP